MKYYLAINSYGVKSFFTDEDLDAFAEENGGNRNPYDLFSGVEEQDIVTDIFVCELTNKGLIYKKRLNRNLEEVPL